MATGRPKASGYPAPVPGGQQRPRQQLRPAGFGSQGRCVGSAAPPVAYAPPPQSTPPQLTARGGHPLPASANEVVRFLTQQGLHMYAQVLLDEGFDEMETLQAIEEKDMIDLGMGPHHVSRLKRSLEVVGFLRQHELEQYGPKLLEHGFDEMATLVEITEDDLRNMGIVRGHVLKLKRHLREYAAQHSLYSKRELTPELRRDLSSGSRRSTPERGSRSVTPEGDLVEQYREFSLGSKPPAIAAMDSDLRMAVQKSWEKVQEIGTLAVAELLMKHTLELDPEAIRLYTCKAKPRGDETITDVARKLFARTLYVVGSSAAELSDKATVVKNLTGQGAALANSGIKESYFNTVGIAFQMTLKEVLRDRFTAEVAATWKSAYDFMTAVMVSAMRSAGHTEEGQEASSS